MECCFFYFDNYGSIVKAHSKCGASTPLLLKFKFARPQTTVYKTFLFTTLLATNPAKFRHPIIPHGFLCMHIYLIRNYGHILISIIEIVSAEFNSCCCSRWTRWEQIWVESYFRGEWIYWCFLAVKVGRKNLFFRNADNVVYCILACSTFALPIPVPSIRRPQSASMLHITESCWFE